MHTEDDVEAVLGGLSEDRLEFTRQFLITALWSESDESTDSGGVPFDWNYAIDDITTASSSDAKKECLEFMEKAGDMLLERDFSQAGHDFYLTRVGHGAGFWDGDWPINGDALTDLAHSFGEMSLSLGDDGKIYIDFWGSEYVK